jgi:DNA primase
VINGDVERVKQLSDILSVVGRAVSLKQSGASHKGLCPFHQEKTPSFYVFPRTGTWHCFGCGAGGDVIAFVMRYGNLSFREALEELADQCGVVLERKGSWTGPETGLLDVLRDAQKWFADRFRSREGAAAREYLQGRNLLESADSLGVGYSPEGLAGHLRSLGYSDSQAEQAGLLLPGSDGRRERFRHRITFPIRDRRGRVVSFGGRTLGEQGPKYLNGPDTDVYHKGGILYGYSDAAPAARESGLVILVEGYFDHARVAAGGFQAVVATCGTALTEIQARTLRGMAEDTVICYDGDQAGTRAAVKAAVTILAAGGFPRIVRLPEGMDPDDHISSRGMDSFMDLVEKAPGPVGFCLELLEGGFPKGVAGVRTAKRLMEIVSACSDPLVREQLLLEVESASGFSRAALENHLKYSGRPEERLRTGSRDGSDRTDDALAAALVAGGSLDCGLLRWLEPGDFRSESGRSLFLALKRQMEEGCVTVNFGVLSPEHASICSRLASSLEGMKPGDRELIRKRVENRRLLALEGQLRSRLREELSAEERSAVLNRMQELARRRHAEKD